MNISFYRIIQRKHPGVDKNGKYCMSFVRSVPAAPLNCRPNEKKEQMNMITHWLDSSNIYGSGNPDKDKGKEEQFPEFVRLFQDGLLNTTKGEDGFDHLPFNPNKTNCGKKDAKGKGSDGLCPQAGDERAFEQPGLFGMHTLWVREHNRIATELKELNPTWDDHQLFQESRRIVNAEYQHIIYNEWLPILLGWYMFELRV